MRTPIEASTSYPRRSRGPYGARLGRAAALLSAVLLVAAVLPAQPPEPGPPVPTPTERGADHLRAELARHFEIIPVSDGVVLKPLSEKAGVRAVEVTPVGIALDGVRADAAEVRERLGKTEADLVLRAADLDADALAALGRLPAEAPPETAAVEPVRPPAPPQPVETPKPPAHPVRLGEKVVFGGGVTIRADEVARQVVVFGGPARVEGSVEGDVVAIGGPVHIDGEVGGDVAAVGGPVFLGPRSRVGGDVQAAGGSVHKEPGAQVDGTISEVSGFRPFVLHKHWAPLWRWDRAFRPEFRAVSWVAGVTFEILGLAFLALFVSLALLIAPRPAERVATKVSVDPWKSLLAGVLAALLFLPLLILTIVILVISIVGIPLLVLIPFALLALACLGVLGLAGVSLRLGRWSEERFGWRLGGLVPTALVGLGMIEIWGVLAKLLDFGWGPVTLFSWMVALFAAAVEFVAWSVGFGAVLLTRLGAGPKAGTAGAAPPPPVELPPGPPPAE